MNVGFRIATVLVLLSSSALAEGGPRGASPTPAALLPWVMAYNAPAAGVAMAGIAAALGSKDAVSGMLALARTLRTPTLAELGFTQEMIPRAAALACGSSYPNPRTVDERGVRSILEHALVGQA